MIAEGGELFVSVKGKSLEILREFQFSKLDSPATTGPSVSDCQKWILGPLVLRYYPNEVDDGVTAE